MAAVQIIPLQLADLMETADVNSQNMDAAQVQINMIKNRNESFLIGLLIADGYTTATGSNNEGCPCSTFQFGCCPGKNQKSKLFDLAKIKP